MGSNLGDRRANMVRALEMLPPMVLVEAVSSLYESPPQPPAPPPSYYNAAVRVTTNLAPEALLRHLKRIESDLGRREARERWAPRPIDLDIALYDDLVLETEMLTIPHPRILERAFVLRPLLDLDADLLHPVTAERLDVLLQALGDDGLALVEGPGWAP
ncbi:MAG TPA: 2-amino-4-hydroxy-6-hydroxymethyldihydropteridine diphosphokinase [Dehalococcoidia bacterium]|nr:2-amino-4-hydroxy-6-hydroxymethyldihydropteridine diphosphokinase [Dehalococcoidia bacterium]